MPFSQHSRPGGIVCLRQEFCTGGNHGMQMQKTPCFVVCCYCLPVNSFWLCLLLRASSLTRQVLSHAIFMPVPKRAIKRHHSDVSAIRAGNQPLTCKAWSDISPAVKDRSQGAFLLLKSDNAIAVKFSSGVLVISVAKGSIQHATFIPGDTLSCHCSEVLKE